MTSRNLEDFELLNVASQLQRAARHAYDYHGGAIPITDCEAVVEESYQLLERTAVIKHHLVALAERWSLDRLRRVGILRHGIGRTALEVLFVDADDSGLAAIAAGLLTGYGRGRVHCTSAGTRPAIGIDAALARAAAEIGLDLAEAFPKSITREALQVADVVVTLGAARVEPTAETEDGPRPVEQQVRHWDLPDPTGQADEVVRGTLDDLDRQVLTLLLELRTPAEPADPQ